jgi:hypothetical protein
MRKHLLFIILFISAHSAFSQQGPDGPPWYFINTGVENQHIVLVLPTVPITIDGEQILPGDYIGAFYKFNDTLLCGSGTGATGDIGGMKYTGDVNAATIWGAEQNVNNGFQDGELMRWKIWRASDGSVFDTEVDYYTPGSLPSINADSLFHANFQSALFSISTGSIPGIDASVNGQYFPLSGCGLDSAEEVSVLLGNHDTVEVYEFYLNYSINNGDTITELVSDTIPADSTIQFTFSQTVDLSVPGDYEFDIWVDAAGDVNYSNDYNRILVQNTIAPVVTLPADTAICAGDTIPLFPIEEYDEDLSYVWDDDINSYYVYGIEEGYYQLVVTNLYDCSDIDSIYLTVNPNPVVEVQDTVTFCENASIIYVLDESYEQIDWSNGTHSEEIEISTEGSYVVTVSDSNGCRASDTLVAVEVALPVIDLGADFQITYLDSVVLDAGQGYDAYLWNTGSSTQYFYPDTFGKYTVEAWTGDCKGGDAIVITFLDPDTIPPITGLTLFPNPADEFLTILHKGAENGVIKVYNTIGQIVRTYRYSGEGAVVIDVSRFRHGVYIIHIETGEETFIKRIVKS